MPPANPNSILVYGGAGALVIWRVYARIRRFISRQQLSVARIWTTLVAFPLLTLALLTLALGHPLTAAVQVSGIVVGVLLGAVGLRKTKYENTPQGLFYTPNAHIGIVLSLLFVGRLVYRYAQTFIGFSAFAAPQTDFVRSPITLAVFGTLAGYYTTYAVGLLKWHRQVALSDTHGESPTQTN